MAQGAPQDITNDILGKLHALEDQKSPTEFSIKLLEREIEKLKSVNYAQYFFLRGSLLALQWKVDDAVKSLNTSMSFDCDQKSIINAGVNFHAMGLYEKAFETYKKAFDIPGVISSSYFNNFAQCAFLLGRYNEIDSYISLRKLQCNKEELNFLNFLNDKYTKVFECVDRKVFSDFAKLMIKSAVINKKRVHEVLVDFIPEGETKVFIRFVVQHSDFETVQLLNDTLIDLVCENPNIDLLSLDVNGCFSHSSNFNLP